MTPTTERYLVECAKRLREHYGVDHQLGKLEEELIELLLEVRRLRQGRSSMFSPELLDEMVDVQFTLFQLKEIIKDAPGCNYDFDLEVTLMNNLIAKAARAVNSITKVD